MLFVQSIDEKADPSKGYRMITQAEKLINQVLGEDEYSGFDKHVINHHGQYQAMIGPEETDLMIVLDGDGIDEVSKLIMGIPRVSLHDGKLFISWKQSSDAKPNWIKNK